MTAGHITTEATESVRSTTAGFGASYAITSILSALLVVLKESSEGVHDALTAVTGHHWVTHGLLDVIVFLVLGFILARRSLRMTSETLLATIVGSTVLSGLIIAGYFI
jgi:uncharacterized transporter YbjL